MRMSIEHERLVRMIKESISLMCKSSLSYDLELNVEGLLGITLDKKDVVLVNINESFQSERAKSPPPEKTETKQSELIEIKGEEDNPPSCARKRRARRRSHDMPVEDNSSHTEVSADFELPEFSVSSQTGLREQSTDYDLQSPARKSSRLGRPDGASPGVSRGHSFRQSSGDLNFEEIVIKEEVGDDGDNENMEDFSFTGDSFASGQQPYPTSDVMPGSSEDASQIPGSYPIASASTDESQTGIRWPPSTPSLPPDALSCHICGNVYTQHCNLLRHMSAHGAPLHICKFCGKRFHRSDVKARHEASQHQK